MAAIGSHAFVFCNTRQKNSKQIYHIIIMIHYICFSTT